MVANRPLRALISSVATEKTELTMRKLDSEEMVLIAGGEGHVKTTAAFDNSASKCNMGLGNGDQRAPGNSYPDNQAENTAGAEGGSLHQSGFPTWPNEC